MNAWARIEDSMPTQSGAFLPAAFRDRQTAAREAAKQEVMFLLRGLGTVMNYPKGAPIFAEGGNAHAVYRVISGAIALWRTLPNGKRHIVDFRLAGEFLGVVHRPTHTINAEAASDCIVIAWRRGEVDGICDAVPSFRRSMETLLAEPVVTRSEIAAAESRTAKERVADFLLKAFARATDGGDTGLPLSGRDIGDRIDAPCELVANGLRDLESAGAIAHNDEGKLVMLNPALLESAM